jgi:hypothetical protein
MCKITPGTIVGVLSASYGVERLAREPRSDHVIVNLFTESVGHLSFSTPLRPSNNELAHMYFLDLRIIQETKREATEESNRTTL